MRAAPHSALGLRLACALTGLLIACLPAMTAELSLGLPRDEGGLRVYEILLTPGPGDHIAGLQTTVTLPPGWVVAGVAAGAAAQRANKQVLSAMEGASMTLMVAGFNQETLGAGAVAAIHLEIPAGSAPGSPRLDRPVLSSPEGEEIGVYIPSGHAPAPDGGKEDASAPPAGGTAPREGAPRSGDAGASDGPGPAPGAGNHDGNAQLSMLAGILGLSDESPAARPAAPTAPGAARSINVEGGAVGGGAVGAAGLAAPTPSRGLSTAVQGAPMTGPASNETSMPAGAAPGAGDPAFPGPVAWNSTSAEGGEAAHFAALRNTGDSAQRLGLLENGRSPIPSVMWWVALAILGFVALLTLRGRFMRGA